MRAVFSFSTPSWDGSKVGPTINVHEYDENL